MSSVRVVGSEADLLIAGGGAPETEASGLVVVLGEHVEPGLDEIPAVRWIDGGSMAGAAERLIASAGDALWSRRPWPAADALFDLPPAPEPRTALLAGDRDGLKATLLQGAVERGLGCATVDRLTVESLRAADCVVLLDGEPGTISALAPAVLAARRILITPKAETAFGLQAPLDHLQFDAPERALNLVESVLGQPSAFERLRIWGALAAERHRASQVYAQLAIDVAAEERAQSRR